MERNSTFFQRDQKKKPTLNKLFTNGYTNTLSTPFSFMEFGTNSSNISQILQNFSKDSQLSRSTTPKTDGFDILNQSSYTSFKKPLGFEVFKPTPQSKFVEDEYSPIYYLNKTALPLRSNGFSDNYFLRMQNTRNENIGQPKLSDNCAQSKMNNNFNNAQILPSTRPVTSNINERKKEVNSWDSSSTKNGIIDVKNSLIDISPVELKLVRTMDTKNVMPVVNTPVGNKFYLKSYKTDSLLYNPNNKVNIDVEKINSAKPILDSRPFSVSTTSQSLYQQVKKEVEEYRKQRRKEAHLDFENVAPVKVVEKTDELFQKPLLKKLASIENNSLSNLVNKSNNYGSLENILNVNNVNNDNSQVKRPKSVTFSDRIEKKDFVENTRSEIGSKPEVNIENANNHDDQESLVSTESDTTAYTDCVNSKRGNGFSNKTEKNENKSDDESENEKSDDDIDNDENSDATSNINLHDTYDIGDDDDDDDTDSNETADSSDESNDDHKDVDNDNVLLKKTKKSNDSIKNIKENGDIRKDVHSSSSELQESLSSSSSVRSCISTTKSSSSSSSVSTAPTTPSPVSENKIAQQKLKKDNSVLEVKLRSKSLLTIKDLKNMQMYKNSQLNSPLIFSKFPNMPPVINFVQNGEKIEQLPWQLRKLLKWRTSLLTPVIVKQTITRSGFRPSRLTTAADDLESTETDDWILYFGKHMRGPIFKTIKEYQKINHLPGSFQLGRKDRLWRNISRMQQNVNKKEFDFIPQTFCLPTDLEIFKDCWEKGGNKYKWIIKPPASARGIGVKVVHKWNQIPKKRPVVVQRYISNPYLINDSKFDLRLYVFITSVDPLRIYLFTDGLVRFASTKYTNSIKSLHNRYVHLTNYSINKLNVEYLDNNDIEACKGHKWSLKSLWTYMKRRGINTDTVWHRIKDLVVKTVISAEDQLVQAVKTYSKSIYSVQELFGFDVILDENLKPWILEVNVSPSLHSDSPLDIVVKGNMIKDMFNLSGFLLPEPQDVDEANLNISRQKMTKTDLYLDRRFWSYQLNDNELAKHEYFVKLMSDSNSGRFNTNRNLPMHMLDCLTPYDVRLLLDSLDEYERRGGFERIYPVVPGGSSSQARHFLSCFEGLRYSNLLLVTFSIKYSRNQASRILESLCQKKLHLLSAANGDQINSKHIWSPPTAYNGNY